MSGSAPENGIELPVDHPVYVITMLTPIRDPQIHAWPALDSYRTTPNSAEP